MFKLYKNSQSDHFTDSEKHQMIADYYALDKFTPDLSGITVFKNGGGAHLDLMTSRYIIDKFKA